MTSTHLKTSDISVIIPTLNEQDRISSLAEMLSAKVGEIILVDGGSSDETLAVAERTGFIAIAGEPGRARQMNTGAKQAAGKILLFLHADTILPDRFAEIISETMNDGTTILCAFALGIETSSVGLKIVAGAANLRSRWLSLPYGDQGLALKKTTFEKLGGYPELPIMEDYELVRKAGKLGSIKTLGAPVRTSDRRWRRLGVLQTTLINQLVVAGYKLGIAPEKLASLYRSGLFGGN